MSLPTGPELESLLESEEAAMYEDLFDALPAALASELGLEASRVGGALRMTARAFDHPMFNRVLAVDRRFPANLDSDSDHSPGPGRSLSPRDAAELLGNAREHYDAAGVRRWMVQILPHMESDALREAAQEWGVVRLRGWVKHLARAEEAGRAVTSRGSGSSAHLRGRTRSGDTSTPQLHVIRLDAEEAKPVGGLSDLVETWAHIVVDGFGLPPSFGPWLSALAGRERWRLYAALHDGKPVATGALYLPRSGPGSFGHLNFAATLTEHRRRGAQSAIIARRLEDARGLGAEWIFTETDEALPDGPNPSQHNLIRQGLPIVYLRSNWGPPKPEE